MISLILGFILACIDDQSTRRVLTQQGYSDIEITGYRWFGCSKDDWYHTGFKAKSSSGLDLTGVVCEGMFFKGNTIRFD